jgi:hypothetical protein
MTRVGWLLLLVCFLLVAVFRSALASEAPGTRPPVIVTFQRESSGP